MTRDIHTNPQVGKFDKHPWGISASVIQAAFANDPTGPNQVWQLGFSQFETTTCGTWPLAGCRD